MRVFGYPIWSVQVSRTPSEGLSRVLPAYLDLDRGQGIDVFLKEGTRSDQLDPLLESICDCDDDARRVGPVCNALKILWCNETANALAKVTGP